MKLWSGRLARLNSKQQHIHVPGRVHPWPLSSSLIVSSSSRSSSIHTTKTERASIAVSSTSPGPPTAAVAHSPPSAPQAPALSCLPLSQVLRTYFITSVSSSPALLQGCFTILQAMLNSHSAVTSVEKNPLLKLLLRETFYKQFCAGTSIAEVKQNIKQLQATGYSGVILEYALEVLADAKSSDPARDVEVWREGLLQTVDMTNPGDFVGLKWSGMGPHALQLLKQQKPPSAAMDAAMNEVCIAAARKSVSLLPAAEETTTTPTIDAWSLSLQKVYNRGPGAPSVIYNTYQAYLKSTPAQLAKHLASAHSEGYTLGVKLVRGAYLGSEPRSRIWPSLEATHEAYDSLAEALLERQYMGLLQPLHGHATSTFPSLNLVLATHNATSVRKAQALRTRQLAQKTELVPLAYAQLQGMADEVSCELIQAGKADAKDAQLVDVPRAYKCTTWGSMDECLNYLLRRASENKDAAGRTAESRAAMGMELRRRLKRVFGAA